MCYGADSNQDAAVTRKESIDGKKNDAENL